MNIPVIESGEQQKRIRTIRDALREWDGDCIICERDGNYKQLSAISDSLDYVN